MINIKAVLTEPEPVHIEITEKTTDSEGRDILVSSTELLPGPYEVHDGAGFGSGTTLTAAGERPERQPLLLGVRNAYLVTGALIEIGGSGPHAGRKYRLGVVNDFRSHIECTLEDV